MHGSGFRAARAGAAQRPAWSSAWWSLHAALYSAAVFTVPSPLSGVVFVLVNQAVFGLYLGAVFAPNHKGMAVYRDGVELDWLHRQVLTSRNIRPGTFDDFVFGGLNYQIEHHLFPSMPRANLRRVRPIVRTYCDSTGSRTARCRAGRPTGRWPGTSAR